MLAGIPRLSDKEKPGLRLMSYFSVREKRTQQMSFRVPAHLKKSVEKLARFYTEVGKLVTGDPDYEENESDMANRLLASAKDAHWAEFGGEPQTEEQLRRMVQAVARAQSNLDKHKK